MKVQPVCLDADDAVELGELLEFLGRWLASDSDALAASITRIAGHDTYGIDDLRNDVSRFAFILGGDGELLVGGYEQ